MKLFNTQTTTGGVIIMLSACALYSNDLKADSIHEALSNGKATVDFRLRYEGVSQDNALSDADAFTFRTLVGYQSGEFEGWSFTVELEDNRIALGQGDYTVGPAGYNPGIYSVIADPEFSELDQAFVQYKKDELTVKIGRQVIALDDQRFVGHVGWRQDRQTFDAATFVYNFSKNLKAQYSHITQRNRIFGEFADIDSKDHLFNVGYKTSYGQFTGYAYLLEVDNVNTNSVDTFGGSFKGDTQLENTKLLYTFAFATQSAESGTAEFDASYLFAELGAVISGITAKVGYEVLGSDGANYGFATPLATLHKFNGWSDQFLGTPAQGLRDTSITLGTKLLGGNVVAIYHHFEVDTAPSSGSGLGSEINLQYTTSFAKKYSFGFKYADYSGEGARVDAQKIWLWLGTKF